MRQAKLELLKLHSLAKLLYKHGVKSEYNFVANQGDAKVERFRELLQEQFKDGLVGQKHTPVDQLFEELEAKKESLDQETYEQSKALLQEIWQVHHRNERHVAKLDDLLSRFDL